MVPLLLVPLLVGGRAQWRGRPPWILSSEEIHQVDQTGQNYDEGCEVHGGFSH